MQTIRFSFFYEKWSGLLDNILSQVCNHTDTINLFTNVFKFLLSFIQLPENNNNSMISWIIKAEPWGMSFLPQPKAEADTTQNPNLVIFLSYII